MAEPIPYHWLQRLGVGATGEVWAARREGRELAVKVLRRSADAQQEEAIRREIVLGPLLRGHPGVVAVEQVEARDGLLFLEMEWVRGPNLAQVLEGWLAAQGAPIPPSVAVGWAVQVLETLHWAAARVAPEKPATFVHRDIKPANLLLDTRGRVRVTDFGIARAQSELGFQATQAGVVKGSPRFMSPELLGERGVDCRSDQFSVGAVLYELLSGEPLYRGRDMAEIVLKAAHADVKPQLDALQGPRAVTEVLRRLLAARPEERFTNNHDAAAALAALQLQGPDVRLLIDELHRCATLREADSEASFTQEAPAALSSDPPSLTDPARGDLPTDPGAGTRELQMPRADRDGDPDTEQPTTLETAGAAPGPADDFDVENTRVSEGGPPRAPRDFEEMSTVVAASPPGPPPPPATAPPQAVRATPAPSPARGRAVEAPQPTQPPQPPPIPVVPDPSATLRSPARAATPEPAAKPPQEAKPAPAPELPAAWAVAATTLIVGGLLATQWALVSLRLLQIGAD